MFSIEPLGDEAHILRNLDLPAWQIARALNSIKPIGLIEAVPAYDTVGLYVDPSLFDGRCLHGLELAQAEVPTRHRIPVCYNLGPDLGSSAASLEISVEDLIQAHTDKAYTCYALGFCPGFPYLGYLSDRISGLPRLPQPRLKVPKGAIGVTGRQTAIYPSESPGGWNLIGLTPLEIVGDDYFPISAGDEIMFYAISELEYHKMKGKCL